MHTETFKVNSQKGVLAECDRSLYQDRNGEFRDCVSKSRIDFERTGRNYQLSSHSIKNLSELKELYEKKSGRKMRTDAVYGGTVLTLPKDFKGDEEEFFIEAYNGLKQIYHIKEDDVIMAYVHKDESTPHMHFYFIPTVYGERTSVNWNKCVPRNTFVTQHRQLQNYLKGKGIDANILNGETVGLDFQKLTKEQKEEGLSLQKTNEQLKGEIEACKAEIEPIKKQAEQYVNIINQFRGMVPFFRSYFEKWKSYLGGYTTLKTKMYYKAAQEGIEQCDALESQRPVAKHAESIRIVSEKIDYLKANENELDLE